MWGIERNKGAEMESYGMGRKVTPGGNIEEIFKPGSERWENVNHTEWGAVCSKQQKQHVQRPWGETASQNGLNVRQLCHWSEFLFYVLVYIFHFSSLDIPISSVIKAGTKSVSTFSQVTSAPDSLRKWSQCSFLLSPSFSLWSHTNFFLVFVYQLIAQLVKNLPAT